VEEEEKMGGVVAQGMDDAIQWEDKQKAMEQLKVLAPQYEKRAIKFFWELMDDVGVDPEEMDVKKLQTKAVAILTGVAKKYLVAAGGGDDTIFSLMMKEVGALVKKERKRSRTKVNTELREAHGTKLMNKEIEMGLKDGVAGLNDKIKELGATKTAKDMKEMAKATEAAEVPAAASEVALGTSEGELLVTKQQHGGRRRGGGVH
jgi:hypothetical protein